MIFGTTSHNKKNTSIKNFLLLLVAMFLESKIFWIKFCLLTLFLTKLNKFVLAGSLVLLLLLHWVSKLVILKIKVMSRKPKDSSVLYLLKLFKSKQEFNSLLMF